MSIKLIVFDIAGTTVRDNQEVSQTFHHALKKHGYLIEIDNIDPLMGYEKNLAILTLLQTYEPDGDKITPELVKRIHTEFVQLMINHYKFSPDIEPLPNVEETFQALHQQGVQIAINTGFSKDIAEVVVGRLQWQEKGLIDHLIGSDEVPQGRPHPFMIEKLMVDSGITDPSAIAKVGDTEVDVREGQNANCRYVIGITTGIFTRQELEKYHPTHIIDDIREVLAIINQ